MADNRLAVFVSGEGSLFQFLVENQIEDLFTVNLVVTSKESAPAVSKAEAFGLPVLVFNVDQESELLQELLKRGINFVILAGFLKKVPLSLIHHFRGRMINTHPSLLPKFGGKGMYGLRVHRAVLASGETETGCSTHFVTENYDEGEIIRQQIVPIARGESVESLQSRVKWAERINLLESLKQVLGET